MLSRDMGALAVRAHYARYTRLQELLLGFCAERRDDPVAAVMWSFAAAFKGFTEPGPFPVRQPRAVVEGRRLARDVIQRRARARHDFFGCGDALVVVESENQRRVLEPVVRALECSLAPAEAVVPWREARRLSRHAVGVADEFLAQVRRAGAELGMPLELYYQLARDGAHALGFARVLLRARSPRVAVIGSTHGRGPRALAAAAHEGGVPSVYVPHAPVVANRAVVDLPVDFAGLRGPAEVAFYGEAGVDAERLFVAGNPSLSAEEVAAPDPGLAPVFAPLSDEFVDVLAEAWPERLIVSPHPRSDVDALRARAPSAWEFWDGRTYDLLRKGPRAVVQHSSGVGLEALWAGVPVVELAVPGVPANYPALREPHVRAASDAPRLRELLLELPAEYATRESRLALRAWAEEWNAPVGEAAAARAADLVRDAGARGAFAAPIWDVLADPVPLPGSPAAA
jgi:hypothetical protein